MSMNWGKFNQSLYVSPYQTVEGYLAHYVIDSIITIVLILWIYKTSHWCSRIQRDSIIALVCCVCIVEDPYSSAVRSNTSTMSAPDVNNYNKMTCDKATLYGRG